MSRNQCPACHQEAMTKMGARFRRSSIHTCQPGTESYVLRKDDNDNFYLIPPENESEFTRLVWRLKNRPHDVSFADWVNELIDKFDKYKV